MHGLEVLFYPEFKSIDFKERICAVGTKFVNIDKNELLPEYGVRKLVLDKYVMLNIWNQCQLVRGEQLPKV